MIGRGCALLAITTISASVAGGIVYFITHSWIWAGLAVLIASLLVLILVAALFGTSFTEEDKRDRFL